MLVVKAGGGEGVDMASVCADVAALVEKGEEVVLVHGGSHETTVIAEKLGHPPRFVTSVSGHSSRYTDRQTLEILTMVTAGKINKLLVERLQQLGANALGLEGDSSLGSISFQCTVEGSSALDVTVQAQILRLLLDLRERRGLSIILVTHDLSVVAQTCGTVAVMYTGRLVERATKQDLLLGSLHPYTKGLLKSVPKAEQAESLSTIPGTVPNLDDPPLGCRFHPRCPQVMEICPEQKPPTIEHSPGHYVACYLYMDKEPWSKT